jgi:tetratricopeptide (TPR) repeat protein
MKDIGEALKFLQYVPQKFVFAALVVFALLAVLLAILKSDILQTVSSAARERLVTMIIRYGFALTSLVCLTTMAWAISGGISEKTEVKKGIEAPAESGSKPASTLSPIVPPGQLNDLAEQLVFLSRKLNAPAGITEALEKLKKGDAQLALVILQSMTAAQKNDADRAQALRRIGLLAFYKDTEISLESYRQSVALDPNSWEAWSQIAFLLERRGDFAGARSAIQRAFDIAKQLQDNMRALATANNVLGIIENDTGHSAEAREAFDKSRGLFLAAGAKIEYAQATNNLARVHYASGEYETATRYLKQALEVDVAESNQRGIAADYLGLGSIAREEESYDEAIDYLTKSASISEDIEDLRQQALALSELGWVYLKRQGPGDLDKPLPHFERALKLQQKLGNPSAIAFQFHSLGALALARKDYETAEARYADALKLTNVSPVIEAAVQRGLGKAYLAQRKGLPAVDAFRRALQIDTSLKRNEYVALDQVVLGQAYQMLGQVSDGCTNWRSAEQFYADDGRDEDLAQVRALIASAACQN